MGQSEWTREFWGRSLRALNIKPRKFYATRHTFISIALTAGVPLMVIAEHCGTSVTMMERHYGRFLQGGSNPWQVLEEREAISEPRRARASGGAKTETFESRFQFGAEKPLRNIVVPTGVEPVLPT